MVCQSCGEQEANVVITKMVANQSQVVQLCQQCAETFGGPGGVAVTIQAMTEPQDAAAVCSSCGKSFSEFRKSGLFGCPDCYDAFEAYLPRLFRRVQGVSAHAGSEPPTERLSDLESQLKDAVAREAYEEAANLRDRIGRLKTEAP